MSSSRILRSEESYVRLLDSSGSPIITENGALNINGSFGSSVTVSGQTFSNGRLLTDISGSLTASSSLNPSTTTLWNGTFGDTSVSAVHDGTNHGKYSIFGLVDGECTLKLEFSATNTTWYETHHLIMVGSNGIIDGGFDDIMVPYIRLKNVSDTDICGTVIMCGKGL